ncbi:MAG: YggS family pyridoxal phosphate-dependent enzyme [Dermatophilaceae bacterium]
MTSISRDGATRLASLSASLGKVEDRIRAACTAAGRARGDVQLIVVTKFFPGADIDSLCSLGVTDIGENRDQEASAKIAALTPEIRQALHVHFIGQLQTNKAGSVASYADTVHSIDRARLVAALDRAAAASGRQIGALVQVDLGGSSAGEAGARTARGGVGPEGVAELADSIASASHLVLRGLMAVAPHGVDPAQAFEQLARCALELRDDHPDATWISAGMSGDLESAVAHGATHLRVGSAILGSRPPLG